MGNKWNGCGIVSLTDEEKQSVFKKASLKAKKQREGWPENTQGKKWDQETLEACSWEWARLMANSGKAHWK